MKLELVRNDVEFCVPETVVPDIKYLMKKYDYDDLFVVDSMNEKHVVGVIHDKKMSDENLTKSADPFLAKAEQFMEPVTPVNIETGIDECLQLMESLDIDVLPVVDLEGRCCGIIRKEDLILQ